MHGQIIRSIDKQRISEEDTFCGDRVESRNWEWNNSSTGSGTANRTLYNTSQHYRQKTHSKCRLCQQYGKTADHIITVCPILAKEQHIQRHDTVCAELHCNILVCKEIEGKLDDEQWYGHLQKLVDTSAELNVTNRTMESTSANRQNHT